MKSLQVIYPKSVEGNYHYWKAQALFSIRAYELEDHLTGLVTFPSPFLLLKMNLDRIL